MPVLAPRTTGRAWVAPAATGAIALACCAVAGLVDPTRPGSVLLPCPFRALTGWACPVCGSTRMLHELLHGHLVAAARYNVVVLVLLPVLGYGWLAWLVSTVSGRRLPARRPRLAWQRAGLALWLCLAVLRNLPWGPVQSLRA